MPEVIRTIRRVRSDKAMPSSILQSPPKPWYRGGDGNPQPEPVDLKTRESCAYCGITMTAARYIVKCRFQDGHIRRLGPCCPNCREPLKRLYSNEKLFIQPASILFPASA